MVRRNRNVQVQNAQTRQVVDVITPDQQLPLVRVRSGSSLRLPEPVSTGYAWHVRKNERAFQEYAAGLSSARRLHLPSQVAYYEAKIIDTYHEDQVDRVYDLVLDAFGYKGHDYHADEPLSPDGFREVIEEYTQDWEHVKEEWVYYPAEHYREPIPVPALQRLEFLEEEGVAYDARWVADKEETREVREELIPRRSIPEFPERRTRRRYSSQWGEGTERRFVTRNLGPRRREWPAFDETRVKLPDPLLCVSFGRWVLSIAEWI